MVQTTSKWAWLGHVTISKTLGPITVWGWWS